MQLVSSAFQQGGAIPARFTCEGENISPELSWKDAPKETHSFVLVLHDPDAPRRNGFTHWVMFNISPEVSHVDENIPKEPAIPGLGMQAANDSGRVGYTGPCPPSGRHRYFARLYALKKQLPLQAGVAYQEVISAMEGNIIDWAELMGTYEKRSQQAA